MKVLAVNSSAGKDGNWPMAYGQMPEDVRHDEEGLETVRRLGQNMAYLLKVLKRRNGA